MDKYVQLAKEAVEKYASQGVAIDVPKELDKELCEKKGGVFVTLHMNGDLRGCIGTIMPMHENAAAEIISNAIAACSRDDRFLPVSKDELESIEYEVSILSVPRKIENIKMHDPQKHGIIIQARNGRSGLLLPGLEGIDTTEQQIKIAAQKGGIDFGREKVDLFEFEIEKHQ